jgi:hypothetical protein
VDPAPPFYDTWSFWLYAAAWLPYTACLLLYGLRSPWWAGATGRAILALYAALTGVLTLALVARIFDIHGDLLDALRFLLLGAVAVLGFVQLHTIVRLQRRDRDGHAHPHRRSTDR